MEHALIEFWFNFIGNIPCNHFNHQSCLNIAWKCCGNSRKIVCNFESIYQQPKYTLMTHIKHGLKQKWKHSKRADSYSAARITHQWIESLHHPLCRQHYACSDLFLLANQNAYAVTQAISCLSQTKGGFMGYTMASAWLGLWYVNCIRNYLSLLLIGRVKSWNRQFLAILWIFVRKYLPMN